VAESHATVHLLMLLPTDIHFGNQVPTGVSESKSTIDIAALKTLGDKQAKKLAQALGV
jgi:hypothetical protein